MCVCVNQGACSYDVFKVSCWSNGCCLPPKQHLDTLYTYNVFPNMSTHPHTLLCVCTFYSINSVYCASGGNVWVTHSTAYTHFAGWLTSSTLYTESARIPTLIHSLTPSIRVLGRFASCELCAALCSVCGSAGRFSAVGASLICLHGRRFGVLGGGG